MPDSFVTMPLMSKIVRVVLSVFVAAYLLAFLAVGSPYSPLTGAWCNILRPPFNYFGLFNNFGVFAPNPATYNQEFRAVIQFKDGTKKSWKFPSLLDWKSNDVMKQKKLPWVEWEYYFLWDPQNVVLLPDAAQYLAYQHRNPQNPPVKVNIYRDYNNIALPVDDVPQPVVEKTDLLLEYDVQEQDLL